MAVKFGVVAFDAFQEFLGGLTAVTMDPPHKNMKWDFRPSYLFLFKKYGVMGAFVKQARMKDGTIWNANEKKVFRTLRERYKSITKEKFEKMKDM